MKKFLYILGIALGLTPTTQAQVGCDMMGLIVNVSDTDMVKLYHPGNYLTSPQNENVIVWEITDMQGNLIAEDTLINNSNFLFYHNTPLTDTMNVFALLTNASAGVACVIYDQLYWKVTQPVPGYFYGYWTLHGNIAGNLGIDDIEPTTASVYPNPSNDLVNISLDKGDLLKIELYSMTGRLLFKQDVNSKTYILNIGDYPSGGYLVRVFNQNNDVTNTKILKTN